jgi:hypothetical protein
MDLLVAFGVFYALLVICRYALLRYGMVTRLAARWLCRCFRLMGAWLQEADAWLAIYADNVDECRREVVVSLLGMWMNDQIGDDEIADLDVVEPGFDEPDVVSPNPLRTTMKAVHNSYNKVGLRERNPASAEAIGRQIRTFMTEEGLEIEEISFWSEVGIQMYFNPPYHVRAAPGRIEGFR